MTDAEYQRLVALVPVRMTEGAYGFFGDVFRVLKFQAHIEWTANTLDELAKASGTMFLTNDELDETEAKMWVGMRDEGYRAVERMRAFDSFQTQMVFARFADSFLIYVSDLLSTVYRAKPQALRSSEQVRLDEVLQYSTMEELVGFLVERKIHDLSYQGIAKLNAILEKEMNFALFPDPGDLTKAIQLIEQRNLLAHARGVVNRVFLHRVPNSGYREGERLRMNAKSLTDDVMFFALAVVSLDARAIQKFGLEPTHKPPPQNKRIRSV